MTAVDAHDLFAERTGAVLSHLEETGQLKRLQTIEGPMGPTVRLRGHGEVVCLCSNNYLGLANHADVVEAGHEGLRRYGAGTASVRFICGTFDCHERLEARIAELHGVESSYTFSSCWNANEAIFATLCEDGDLIISDELNHASIIDGIRLAASIKKGIVKTVYRHNDLDHLRERLEHARVDERVTGQIWVVTDGVFSMEGDIADLPGLRSLCDEFDAKLVVDDSHGTGVMGPTGRGTHEHWGMSGDQIDLFTSTLGKALGGGAGGYMAGSRAMTDLMIQRGRPTLFSNALPATIACSADKAIEILMREPERVERLRRNTARVREGIREVGFEVLESPTAICPIIVHDTARAIAMSRRLLELGVFVIGFGYPVVPEGEARLRCQISAAHEESHLERFIEQVAVLKQEF